MPLCVFLLLGMCAVRFRSSSGQIVVVRGMHVGTEMFAGKSPSSRRIDIARMLSTLCLLPFVPCRTGLVYDECALYLKQR